MSLLKTSVINGATSQAGCFIVRLSEKGGYDMAFHSPEDVAAVLKIKASTLRKYALLLQDNGYTFQRNSQGHRWYSDTDITVLRKIITLKRSTDMILNDCTEAALLWINSSDIAVRDTAHITSQDVVKCEGAITPDSLYNALQEQQRTIERVAEILEQQAQHNALIMEELTATRTDVQQLIQQLEFPDTVEKDKRSFWARIRNK